MVFSDEPQGVLAIWNDIRDGRETEFEHWYKIEHFPERLAVPGFKLGRRYEALAGRPRYFCFYLTDSADVLTSPAYRERLNDPTPLTRSIMTGAFANMNRTVCRRILRFGAMWGAISVTARFGAPADQGSLARLLDRTAREEGVARCELWSAHDQARGIEVEEQLRGGDRKIAACAVIEVLREDDADRVRIKFEREFGAAGEIGIYRLLCEIGRADGA